MKDEKTKKSELKTWQNVLLNLAVPLVIVTGLAGVRDLYAVAFKGTDPALMIRVSLYLLACLGFLFAVTDRNEKSPSRYRAAVFVFSAALLVSALTQPFNESARMGSLILFGLVLSFGILMDRKRYAFWLIGGALILSVILMSAYADIDANLYSRFAYVVLTYGFAVCYWFRFSRNEPKNEEKAKLPWRKRKREQK